MVSTLFGMDCQWARRIRAPRGWTFKSTLSLLLVASTASANPVGEVVIAGQATFQRSGSDLIVTQGSDKLIVDWQDFSIGAGELTAFRQPGANSAVLNRVVSGNLSEIFGTLEANGHFYLINPNGLVVGNSGVINTQSFIASTLNVTNDDFLDDGSLHFTGDSELAIINLGSIQAAGGDVFLIAQRIDNQGEIRAQGNGGHVGLVGSNDVLLKASGDDRIGVRVSTGDGQIDQAGLIESTKIELRTAGNNPYALAINHTGVSRATSAVNKEGRIILFAEGGTGRFDGTLDASAPESGNGGFVETSGTHVQIAETIRVDTSAVNGETGTWLIDPEEIEINSTSTIAGASLITASTIEGNLTSNNVTITSNNALAGNGHVTVNESITETSTTNNLTLNAGHGGDINVNQSITIGGDINLNAGDGTRGSNGANGSNTGDSGVAGQAGTDGGNINVNATLTSSGGAINLVAGAGGNGGAGGDAAITVSRDAVIPGAGGVGGTGGAGGTISLNATLTTNGALQLIAGEGGDGGAAGNSATGTQTSGGNADNGATGGAGGQGGGIDDSVQFFNQVSAGQFSSYTISTGDGGQGGAGGRAGDGLNFELTGSFSGQAGTGGVGGMGGAGGSLTSNATTAEVFNTVALGQGGQGGVGGAGGNGSELAIRINDPSRGGHGGAGGTGGAGGALNLTNPIISNSSIALSGGQGGTGGDGGLGGKGSNTTFFSSSTNLPAVGGNGGDGGDGGDAGQINAVNLQTTLGDISFTSTPGAGGNGGAGNIGGTSGGVDTFGNNRLGGTGGQGGQGGDVGAFDTGFREVIAQGNINFNAIFANAGSGGAAGGQVVSDSLPGAVGAAGAGSSSIVITSNGAAVNLWAQSGQLNVNSPYSVDVGDQDFSMRIGLGNITAQSIVGNDITLISDLANITTQTITGNDIAITVANGDLTTPSITGNDIELTVTLPNASIGSAAQVLVLNASGNIFANASNGSGGIFLTSQGDLTAASLNLNAGTGDASVSAETGSLNIGSLNVTAANQVTLATSERGNTFAGGSVVPGDNLAVTDIADITIGPGGINAATSHLAVLSADNISIAGDVQAVSATITAGDGVQGANGAVALPFTFAREGRPGEQGGSVSIQGDVVTVGPLAITAGRGGRGGNGANSAGTPLGTSSGSAAGVSGDAGHLMVDGNLTSTAGTITLTAGDASEGGVGGLGLRGGRNPSSAAGIAGDLILNGEMTAAGDITITGSNGAGSLALPRPAGQITQNGAIRSSGGNVIITLGAGGVGSPTQADGVLNGSQIDISAANGSVTINGEVDAGSNDVNLTGSTGIVATDTITANDITLTANALNAQIGNAVQSIQTNASGGVSASANNGNGGIFLSNAGGVLNINTLNAGTGVFDLIADTINLSNGITGFGGSSTFNGTTNIESDINMTGGITVNGTVNFNSGAVDVNANTLQINGDSGFHGGTLNVNSTGAIVNLRDSVSSTDGVLNQSGGALNFGSTSVNLGALDYNGTGGTATFAGGAGVSLTAGANTTFNNLTVNTGTNLTQGGSGLDVDGALTVNGGLTTGGATADVAGDTTINTGGILTTTNTGINIGGDLSLNGTLSQGASALDVDGNFTGLGALSTSTGSLSIGGATADFSNLATHSVGTGSIILDGGANTAFTSKAGINLHSLTISNDTDVTLAANATTLNGALDVAEGSLHLGEDLTVNGSSDFGNGSQLGGSNDTTFTSNGAITFAGNNSIANHGTDSFTVQSNGDLGLSNVTTLATDAGTLNITTHEGSLITGTNTLNVTGANLNLIASDTTAADNNTPAGITIGTGGISSNGGNVSLRSADDVLLNGQISSGSGNVMIAADDDSLDTFADSDGSILDADGLDTNVDIIANELTLSAGEQIGGRVINNATREVDNALNLQVTQLAASTSNDDISVIEVDDINLADIISNSVSDWVVITTAGDLNRVSGSIDAPLVSLNATGSNSNIGNIAPVVLESNNIGGFLGYFDASNGSGDIRLAIQDDYSSGSINAGTGNVTLMSSFLDIGTDSFSRVLITAATLDIDSEQNDVFINTNIDRLMTSGSLQPIELLDVLEADDIELRNIRVGSFELESTAGSITQNAVSNFSAGNVSLITNSGSVGSAVAPVRFDAPNLDVLVLSGDIHIDQRGLFGTEDLSLAAVGDVFFQNNQRGLTNAFIQGHTVTLSNIGGEITAVLNAGTLNLNNIDGDVSINEFNDVALGTIDVGTNNFTLSASGSITSNDSAVTASNLGLTTTGIDSAIGAAGDSISTTLSGQLTTNATNGSGGVYVSESGSLNVANVNAGSGDVVLQAAMDLVLQAGSAVATSAAANIVLAAGNDFHNDSGGNNPLTVEDGRWLIYSTRPDENRSDIGSDANALANDFVHYGSAFEINDLIPETLPTGDGFVYSVQPVLTGVSVTVNDQTIDYGQSIDTSEFSFSGTPGNYEVDGMSVDAAEFELEITGSITTSDVTLTLGDSVGLSTAGFAKAGSYAGGIEAILNSGSSSGLALDGAGLLTVNKADLNVTLSANDKVYDATTDASLIIASDDRIVGDVLDIDPGSSVFTSKDIGSVITVTVSGSGLTGADANNYNLVIANAGALSADITPADLEITGATADDKIYDGTSEATISGSTMTALGSDVVNLSLDSASFNDKHAGADKNVTASFSLSGADAGNYNLINPAGLTADITPRDLNVSLTADSKVYDATVDATGTLSDDRISGDVLLITEAGIEFNDKNVDTDKTVTASGITISGSDAGNYDLITTAATDLADITPATLTVTLDADSKVYDGTIDATGTLSDDRITGDLLTVTETSLTFDVKDAGADKAVSASGLALGGTDGGNYVLATTSATDTADVSQRDLNITLDAVDKVYDGTTNAGLIASDDRVSGDVLIIDTGSARFDNENVGTGKTVTTSGAALSGTDAGNYNPVIASMRTLAADITPRNLNVALTADNKVYDATLDATGTLSDDRISGDVLVITETGIEFINKTAGSNKTVTAAGVSISGADAGNYTLTNTVASDQADITPATLTVTLDADGKVYDGTTDATGILNDDRITGDLVTVTTTSIDFNDKNAGNGKVVSANGLVLSGVDGANYELATTVVSGFADITRRDLNATTSAADKVYDGNAEATLTIVSDDRIAGDDIVISSGSATFDDKNVGTDKAVTVAGADLSGVDANNYKLIIANDDQLTAGITLRDLNVSLNAADKIYDGTSEANGSLIDDRVAGDDLTLTQSNLSFEDKNAGLDKLVTASDISLSGSDADNYQLVGVTATDTADIAPRDLTVALIAESKVYDGTTDATVSVASDDRVSGDSLTIEPGDADFSDKNAASDKVVTVADVSLGGADASNYNLMLANSDALSAAITPRDLNVSLNADDKAYDGTVTASGVLTDDRLVDDVLTVSETSIQFDDANVGLGLTVTASGIAISGIDASNYDLTNDTATDFADINPVALTVTANDVSQVADGTPFSGGNGVEISGFVADESIDVLGGNLEFTGDAQGATEPGSYVITPTGLQSDNYQISFVDGELVLESPAIDNPPLAGGEDEPPTPGIDEPPSVGEEDVPPTTDENNPTQINVVVASITSVPVVNSAFGSPANQGSQISTPSSNSRIGPDQNQNTNPNQNQNQNQSTPDQNQNENQESDGDQEDENCEGADCSAVGEQ